MRVLIPGAGGMLGQDVASCAAAAGQDVVALPHAELDIRDAGAVQAAVREHRPDAIINCAAWTDVDGAESNAAAALAVNGGGAGNVARAACEAGAWIVHVSSDYVFDGTKREPYVESDATGPISSYGASKLAGEVEVAREAPARHTIVRSSWLFGARGTCFPATILRLAAERDSLDVVDDQVGRPTFTAHLAPALLRLCDSLPVGIVHVAGGGSCSWFEFATEIVREGGLSCEVKPGRTADLGRPAPRPAYSILGTERGEEAPELPDWRRGLQEFLSARAAAEVPAA
jgi:dTDP-4-dehydrorhamnose reductase